MNVSIISIVRNYCFQLRLCVVNIINHFLPRCIKCRAV